VPLCPPQIPHWLTRDRTRGSAMRGRRLAAWAMARPNAIVTLHPCTHILSANRKATVQRTDYMYPCVPEDDLVASIEHQPELEPFTIADNGNHSVSKSAYIGWAKSPCVPVGGRKYVRAEVKWMNSTYNYNKCWKWLGTTSQRSRMPP
jgi:hypothetical protein